MGEGQGEGGEGVICVKKEGQGERMRVCVGSCIQSNWLGAASAVVHLGRSSACTCVKSSTLQDGPPNSTPAQPSLNLSSPSHLRVFQGPPTRTKIHTQRRSLPSTWLNPSSACPQHPLALTSGCFRGYSMSSRMSASTSSMPPRSAYVTPRGAAIADEPPPPETDCTG